MYLCVSCASHLFLRCRSLIHSACALGSPHSDTLISNSSKLSSEQRDVKSVAAPTSALHQKVDSSNAPKSGELNVKEKEEGDEGEDDSDGEAENGVGGADADAMAVKASTAASLEAVARAAAAANGHGGVLRGAIDRVVSLEQVSG